MRVSDFEVRFPLDMRVLGGSCVVGAISPTIWAAALVNAFITLQLDIPFKTTHEALSTTPL